MNSSVCKSGNCRAMLVLKRVPQQSTVLNVVIWTFPSFENISSKHEPLIVLVYSSLLLWMLQNTVTVVFESLKLQSVIISEHETIATPITNSTNQITLFFILLTNLFRRAQKKTSFVYHYNFTTDFLRGIYFNR